KGAAPLHQALGINVHDCAGCLLDERREGKLYFPLALRHRLLRLGLCPGRRRRRLQQNKGDEASRNVLADAQHMIPLSKTERFVARRTGKERLPDESLSIQL